MLLILLTAYGDIGPPIVYWRYVRPVLTIRVEED
jgi:hypothetical protein